MSDLGEKITLHDELLNGENFHRIASFLLERGREMIWSSLYGKGMYFRAGDVAVIYSYLGFGGAATPGPEPLREPFLFIDLYPADNREEHSARCDALFTFAVKAPANSGARGDKGMGAQAEHGELLVRDLTSWYHNRPIAADQVEQNARHAFEVLLEAVDGVS